MTVILFWTIVFILSLVVLVKSADWLVEGAEKIGAALKLSPFIIGVTIVAIGTSFPELAAVLIAVSKGNTEFVVDTAIGSNIATILLIIGISAIVAKKLIVKRSLIDLDAPLLAASTAMMVFVAWDKQVVFWEGVLLMMGFLIYLLYAVFHKTEEYEEIPEEAEVLPSRVERREEKKEEINEKDFGKFSKKSFIFLILGMVGLLIGSNYIVESVSKLSALLMINASFITITAVAIGTSLPELMVSVRAALKKKYELAIGNVFGSNVFTIFLIVGLPALFKPLAINDVTFRIGIPYLVVATMLFIISGISRKIHIWEGAMYILIYILFVVQFFSLF